jgi:hypothetical protein
MGISQGGTRCSLSKVAFLSFKWTSSPPSTLGMITNWKQQASTMEVRVSLRGPLSWTRGAPNSSMLTTSKEMVEVPKHLKAL